MVKDRLPDLQSVLKYQDSEFEFEEQRYGAAYNTVLDIENEEAGYMAHFFSEVELSRLWINTMKEHIQVIKTLHSCLLSSPREDENVKSELDGRTETVKRLAKKVSNNLKALEKEILQEEEELDSKSIMPVGLRIRKTQHATTLHLFMDVVAEFNAVQVDYKEKYEERIQRIISIAKAEITDEKFEELLEKGSYGSIFNGDIITDTLEAKKALEDVQARHQELLKLEKGIMELKTLFVDMAMLIEQQGEIINSIEHHVHRAGEAVTTAKVETKKAIIYQEKARIKKLIILAIIVILVIFLVIFVYTNIKAAIH